MNNTQLKDHTRTTKQLNTTSSTDGIHNLVLLTLIGLIQWTDLPFKTQAGYYSD